MKKSMINLSCIVRSCVVLLLLCFLGKNEIVALAGSVLNIKPDKKIIAEDNNEFTVDTVACLKKTNAKVGDTYQTRGFYSVNDGGGASYYISSGNDVKADEVCIIKLNNGLYANYQIPTDGMVNVLSVGITPDSDVSEKLNILSAYVDGKGRGIKLNNGTYYLDKPVYLRSLAYYGSDNTRLSVREFFATNGDKILLTKPDSERMSFSVELYDIDFYFITSENHSLKDRETVFVALQETDGSIIERCNFYAVPSDINGIYMKVDLLWFKHSSQNKNITVRECNFYNLTGKGYKGDFFDYLPGGCLWICGKAGNYDSEISNVIISDCVFSTTVSDEALSIWNGSAKNIAVLNCSFTNSEHSSHNMISFHKGVFSDTVVKNCSFLLNCPVANTFKIILLADDSDVVCENTTFEYTFAQDGLSAGKFGSTFRISDAYMGGKSSCDFTVKECSIKSVDGTKMYSAFFVSNTDGVNIEISNSEIEVTSEAGLLFSEKDTYTRFSAESNRISTDSCLLNAKNSKDIFLSISCNTIESRCSAVFTGNSTFTYNICNNIFNNDKSNYLIIANRVEDSTCNGVCLINNYFTVSPKIFYCNTDISENEYLNVEIK